MKIKLPSVVTSKVGRTILQTKKSSPRLMFGIGLVAMGATVVLSSRATLKLSDTLDTAEDKFDGRADQKLRTAVMVGQLYAPSIGMGILSVGCLTGAHVTLTKRNAALTAAYAALHEAYTEYRIRVRDEVGDEKERQLNAGIDESDIVRSTKNGAVVSHGGTATGKSPYARLFDEVSPNWSKNAENNRIFLTCQQQYANDRLRSRGHLFLNEVYDSLGLEHTTAGSLTGWIYKGEGDNYVDFGMFDKNDDTRAFINGFENVIWLDFNVDGVIYDKIEGS